MDKDGASGSYLKNIEKVCKETGIDFYLYEFEKDIKEEQIINKILLSE